MSIEKQLLLAGYCHDFYMVPFRFLLKQKRLDMQRLLDETCSKINYSGKINVKIYFFSRLITGTPWAFCIWDSKTIFIQNWLLNNADYELKKFVLCHEIGHIVLDHQNKHAIHCMLEEFAADKFAASIMGDIETGILALNETKKLIPICYSSIAKYHPKLLEPAFFEIDTRIAYLGSLNKAD